MTNQGPIVLNFRSFLFENSVSPSVYTVPGISGSESDGYTLEVEDFSEKKSNFPGNKIIIPQKRGTHLALCYTDSDGNKSEYIWIPYDSCTLSKKEDGCIEKVFLDPYKKWNSNKINHQQIDDFIEEFADSLEYYQKNKSDTISRSAKEDVDLVLDLIGISSPIKSFEPTGDFCWTANLENGMVVDIEKSDSKNLLCKFKIYLTDDDTYPCMYIKNDGQEDSTCFHIDNIGKIKIPGGIDNINSSDPYTNYLMKRSTNLQNYSDVDSLFNHYKTLKDESNKDLRTIIIKLLSEFMDRKEVEKI